MVSNTIIGPIISPNLLIDVPLTHLVFLELLLLICFVLLEYSVELLLKLLQSPRFIAMLVPLILTLRHDSCRLMSRTDCTISLVHVLPSRTTRSICIYTDVLLVNVELLGDIRHDHDRRCARMHATHFLGLGHALHFVHAALVLQVLVDITVPSDLEDAQLAALVDCKVYLVVLLDAPPPFPLAVGFIHGGKVCREETAFAAPSRLSHLQCHVPRVDVPLGDCLVLNLYLKVFQLVYELSKIILSHFLDFFVIASLRLSQQLLALLHLFDQGVEVRIHPRIDAQIANLLADLC